jgi:hypothetical protein
MDHPAARLTAIALTTCALAGCGWRGVATFKATATAAVPAPGATPIDASAENGSISVVKGGTGEVTVVATIRATSQERADAVQVVTERGADGVLTIRARWPGDVRQPSEGCSLEITVPDASGVTLKSSNGSLIARGLRGPASLTTSNGAIRVSDHDGVVTARTSNGSVTVDGAAGASVSTSNGSATVRLRADGAGPLDVSTSNGSITVGVGSAFAGTLKATTSNGRVTNVSGLGKPAGRGTRTAATFDFGQGPAGSLRTSNGSITIEAVRGTAADAGTAAAAAPAAEPR